MLGRSNAIVKIGLLPIVGEFDKRNHRITNRSFLQFKPRRSLQIHPLMFHHQPSSSYFYHVSPSFTANPAPVASCSQPAVPSGVALLPAVNQPGTDPYAANLGSYPSTHVAYEGQTQVFQDPNARSYTGIVEQGDPRYYEFAILSQQYQVTPKSLTSSWTSNQKGQSIVNHTARIPNETNFNQPIRCEVCGIECNSKDVYEKHIEGKKHKNKLKLRGCSLNTLLPKTAHAFNDINITTGIKNIHGLMAPGLSFVTAGEDLEKKKQKVLTGGAAVESVRVCRICNVVCNSQDVFMKHLAGKKHSAQAHLIAQNPFVAAVRSHYDSTQKKIPKPTKISESAWCEVCKINCNSNDVYVKHISGKKHLKNVEKSNNPSLPNLAIGAAENPAVYKLKNSALENSCKPSAQSGTPDDLESKKRKVLEGGAAAGAVQVCTMCSVICNSQTVFNFHLSGQKHANMMKKQQEGSS